MAFTVAGKFSFSCPPKVGFQYFAKALDHARFDPDLRELFTIERHASTKVHHPGRIRDLPAVTLRRPPDEWLRSMYQNLHRLGPVGHMQVDRFFDLNRSSLTAFIEDYLNRMPGAVSEMFASYPADIAIPIGDTPDALVKLLREFEIPFSWGIMDITPQNVTPDKIVLPDELRARILAAEGAPVEAA